MRFTTKLQLGWITKEEDRQFKSWPREVRVAIRFERWDAKEYTARQHVNAGSIDLKNLMSCVYRFTNGVWFWEAGAKSDRSDENKRPIRKKSEI